MDCFKILFFLVIFCVQLLFLDPTIAAKLHRNTENASPLILDGNDKIDKQRPLFSDALLADEKADGIQEGDDLRLRGNGEINITLSRGQLQFEVCHGCRGQSHVCFDSTERYIAPKVKCSGFSSYCKFEVKYDSGYINFGRADILERLFGGSCLRPIMQSGDVSVINQLFFESCEPKFDPVDKMIKLYVDIDPACSIRVMNAKVHVPEITSTPLPSKSHPNDPSTDDPSMTASFPWWLILIIVIVVIAVILGICSLVYHCFFKKRQSSGNIPPPTEVVPTVPKANGGTTLETPSKRKNDLNFTKFEPSKKSKKSQKKRNKKKQKTTQEPTTTEGVPAPRVTVPPAPVQSNPTPFIPYHKRTIPRSLKSVKTDSLDETTKIEKLAMIESAPVSFHHHCVKPADPDLLEEMNENYPEITHVVAQSEVDLLCSPVSKMFASINELAQEYQQKLTSVGCEFNQNGCITSMSDGARRYIHDKTTPASIVYFAFGAEYHEYITDNPELLPQFSIPLLMVIAFQTRFPTANRRKACSLLRRKLPIPLGSFTAVQRKTLAFPINAIEEAYCRDPKYFINTAAIQTDSEGERRKKMKIVGEKKEGKAGDGKRKKKSSKKRH